MLEDLGLERIMQHYTAAALDLSQHTHESAQRVSLADLELSISDLSSFSLHPDGRPIRPDGRPMPDRCNIQPDGRPIRAGAPFEL
jgi:hypothetical protein